MHRFEESQIENKKEIEHIERSLSKHLIHLGGDEIESFYDYFNMTKQEQLMKDRMMELKYPSSTEDDEETEEDRFKKRTQWKKDCIQRKSDYTYLRSGF
ncbi:MAG: hypothetical protein NUV57_01620 [archaeon]|nr:hypothetical protein [archaeon]